MRDPKPAAEYVRMSTEHQRYSIDNQSDAIREYADARGYEIVQTYLDAGKSGLHIKGRSGLKRLLNDIENGNTNYGTVLVYDISRWGRFQDTDEAASYEFRCRTAGIKILYCAEQFENDGSIGSDILKIVKRKMAAEFSRELSVKVFAGKARQIRNGFRQGGAAGLGFRRLLVDEFGSPKTLLGPGEQKAIHTDRIVLVPGPSDEIARVNDIFSWFVEERLTEKAIARRLNELGVKFLGHRTDQWKGETVHDLLVNEKYIGNNVWGKRSTKLKGPETRNPPNEWIRADRAFEPIVDNALFRRAQELIGSRPPRHKREMMLQLLRETLAKNGKLSFSIVNKDPRCPASASYFRRFGGLLAAYRLIGYLPDNRFSQIEVERTRRKLLEQATRAIADGFHAAGVHTEQVSHSDLLRLNGTRLISVEMLRSFRTRRASTIYWKLPGREYPPIHISVIARMNRENTAIQDYLFMPWGAKEQRPCNIREVNGLDIDSHIYNDLSSLYELFRARA